MATFNLTAFNFTGASGYVSGLQYNWNKTYYTEAYLEITKGGSVVSQRFTIYPPLSGTNDYTPSMTASFPSTPTAGTYVTTAYIKPSGSPLVAVGSASSVVPGTPTGVSASQTAVGVKNASVSWGGLTSGATYDIYARISGTSTFYYKASTSGSSATITLDSFSTYDLAVRAIIDGIESPTYGSASVTLYDLPTLSTPSISTQSVTQTSISITLGAITGADAYYARLNGGSWQSGSYPGPFNFTGLTPGTAYTIDYKCTGAGYYDSSVGSSSITTASNARPANWDWSVSNGTATNLQTQNAYNAITKVSGYYVSHFVYEVWNDLIDKVDAFCTYKSSPLVDSRARMTSSDRGLSHEKFNYLIAAVNAIASTGITDRAKDDPVVGSYFTTIVTTLNGIA